MKWYLENVIIMWRYRHRSCPWLFSEERKPTVNNEIIDIYIYIFFHVICRCYFLKSCINSCEKNDCNIYRIFTTKINIEDRRKYKSKYYQVINNAPHTFHRNANFASKFWLYNLFLGKIYGGPSSKDIIVQPQCLRFLSMS